MTCMPSCATCRNYLGGGCCRINLEADCAAGGFEAWEPRKADELPKREQVIGALQMILKTDGKWYSTPVIIEAIALLKAQEPRVLGRWKRVEPGVIECTVCHYPMAKTKVHDEDGHESYVFLLPPYCPMCGAKMDAGAPVDRPGCDN